MTQCIICYDDINNETFDCKVCDVPYHKKCINKWFLNQRVAFRNRRFISFENEKLFDDFKATFPCCRSDGWKRFINIPDNKLSCEFEKEYEKYEEEIYINHADYEEIHENDRGQTRMININYRGQTRPGEYYNNIIRNFHRA